MDAIADDYYRAWFRYHPEAAVDAGVAGYERLLTPYAPEAKGALVCLNDELRVSLEELDRNKLSADQKIDFQIMHGAALLENQHLLEIDARTPDPGNILPVNAVYQLTIRPVTGFADALMARLSAIPRHLGSAQDYLRSNAQGIPAIWLHSAVISARHGSGFIRNLATHPKIATDNNTIIGLNSALTEASQALQNYADFLEHELAPHAAGNFACGKEYFQRLLRYRHFLAVGVDELYAYGQELFDRTLDELKRVSNKIFGHDDIAEATRSIQANRPKSNELLSIYRQQMQAARAFVVAHDLVSLPASERLDVVETPVFLRHQIPFAAYHEPAPNDPAQHGYYYVTPAEHDETLAEHNTLGLMHTCVHEAWPGHHLQFVTANLSPVAHSLPRYLNPSASMYEGWALYCEQLMHEQGFLNRPEQHFILLKDRLWRALRILIDIGIHTRSMTIDQAADLMQMHLGFPRAQAMADLTWYSRSPSVPLGYATGWGMINSLRNHLMYENENYSLKTFHDRLLSAGSIALPLVVQRVFGSTVWNSISEELFGEVANETA